MPSEQFSAIEKLALLQLKGVGPTVVTRLEQIGLTSLAQLQGQDPLAITKQIADMMGSTCWHNSPQARSAIAAIIDLANQTAGD
jgi:hypothetical protein